MSCYNKRHKKSNFVLFKMHIKEHTIPWCDVLSQAPEVFSPEN